MAGIKNNLYPPIIDSWMPAFVRTQECKIYFSLSRYNSYKEIKNVQVIVNDQNTNSSVLKTSLYPTGIKITNLNLDNTIKGDNKYYITISPNDLEGNIFGINQFYKVQIRFTSIDAGDLKDNKKISSWLFNNQDFFSEWSTVCLIKGIEKPYITIRGFEEIENQNSDTIFTSEIINITGRMYYENNTTEEKEYLDHYKIKIYKNSSGESLYDSGIIYTNKYNPNEINYIISYAFEETIPYRMVIEYTTNNGYQDSAQYSFSIIRGGLDPLNVTISAIAENENGRIKIHVLSTDSKNFLGNICIRRSSNKNNFTTWEDVHITTLLENKKIDYTWYDYTIESGVWYKYCVQKINSRGDRGIITRIKDPIMAVFDDIFLVNNKMQLKVKYDPNISSFKRTILESKTDALGSKYPYITRNGNIEYKQFSISGLITSFCDEEGIFLNKDIIYNDSKSLYEEYNRENDISIYRDFIYEKDFRDKVSDFLYDNNIKLFKSATEGNILVKIMDINFTPNATLGRMIYSFSATAYEIDSCNISNYDFYNIQTIGEYSSYMSYNYDKIGQINGVFSKENLLTILQDKYKEEKIQNFINTLDYFKWIRLNFNSSPYSIEVGKNGDLIPFDGDTTSRKTIVSGYIIYINDKAILVDPNRKYYELLDSDTKITSIWFPKDTDVSIDYMVKITEEEDTSKIANKFYYSIKAGQLSGTFDINDSIFKKIYLRYLLNYKKYYQKLMSIDKISVETIPGAIIYIKDTSDDNYYRHTVGETGVLDFYDDEAIISGLYFSGIQMNEAKNLDRDEIEDNDFIRTGLTYNTFEEVKDPLRNRVYTILNENKKYLNKPFFKSDKEYIDLINNKVTNNEYIYYNNQWFPFTEDNIILCPVEGTIDYIYEVMKGEY